MKLVIATKRGIKSGGVMSADIDASPTIQEKKAQLEDTEKDMKSHVD
jgi:hypothetical protein